MQSMYLEPQSSPAANGSRPHEAKLASLAARFDRELKPLSLPERLKYLRREIDGRIVLTTGFGMESQIILHHLAEHDIAIDTATLDTGRLFPETYKLWEDTERRYGRRIHAIFPRAEAVSDLIDEHGINGFYASKDARVSCCHVRKLEPLKRALAGASAWVTGLRGSQSSLRAGARYASVAAEHGLTKINPLFDWSREQVLDFVKAHDVPVNPLHEQGFASIGCAPCTRAIRPGESERAGRWWWEADGKTECGLHLPAPARARARINARAEEARVPQGAGC